MKQSQVIHMNQPDTKSELYNLETVIWYNMLKKKKEESVNKRRTSTTFHLAHT